MRREATVTILDYGAGNLHSLAKALGMPNIRVVIESETARAADPRATDLLVLPGVGAFTAAAERLAPARDAMRVAAAAGFPIIGVCLGMQLLFDRSEEGPGQGLGIIPGVVRRLRAARVPQIGWNTIERVPRSWSDNDGPRLAVAYYANSFACEPKDIDRVTAWTTYEGDRFAASVAGGPDDNVTGVQFHPEKSSTTGVQFLRALVARACAARRS